MTTTHPRVVVTGLGTVTPLGPTLPVTWQRLIAGEDAAAAVTLFDVSGCRCKRAAQATLPEIPHLSAKRLHRFSRGSRLVLPAAVEALGQAGLLDADARSRLPVLTVSVSTTGGGMSLGEQFYRGIMARSRAHNQLFRVARYTAPQQILDLQECVGFRGPVTIIANACASGANAIGHARDLIRARRCECVLAGGYEALTELIYVGFDCLQAMTPETCRPFDTTRNGLMMGEAAAFLVLESENHARERGATILGELAGYGHCTDLHHLTQPQPQGQPLTRAIRMALTDAGLDAAAIGYVNAHGTATLLNDASECAAFGECFGNVGAPFRARPDQFAPGRALPQSESLQVRISSTKAAIGHTLGAAGTIEAVFALQALRTGELPPQLNLRQPEPSVESNLVRGGEKLAGAAATMSVNLGFGGSNAALIFSRYEKVEEASSLFISSSTGNGSKMKRLEASSTLPLAICGMGAVSPAGCGVAPLLETRDVPPGSIGSLNDPALQRAAYRVDLTQERLARWQNEPRLRRAGPVSLFMVEAAQQALTTSEPINRASLGIVAAYHTGAVVPTRRFFEGVVKNGQRFAAPNLFPETVFNSPTSHLASVLGVSGHCYSVVADDSGWVNAISIASCWLANGLVEHVLMVGAEELDPINVHAYVAARWVRRGSRFVPGEGAGAMLLRAARADDAVRVVGLAEGFTFRNSTQARRAAAECVGAIFNRDRPRQESCVTTCRTAQNNWFASIERDVMDLASSQTLPELPYLGETFAASAAWNCIRAATWAGRERQRVLVPVWGLNEQCSALLLEGR